MDIIYIYIYIYKSVSNLFNRYLIIDITEIIALNVNEFIYS